MLTYFVIVPVILAVLFYLMPNAKIARVGAIGAQLWLVAIAVLLFLSLRDNYVGYVYVPVGHYEGVLGIILSADLLTATFVLLTVVMFLLAIIYSFNENNSRLFWFLLFLWQGTLLGVFLTRDFFNIFVLMEVSTLVVSVLIMFNRNNRSLYDGMIYLMINVVIMQFFLFGVGYVYTFTGTLDLALAGERLAELDRSMQIIPFALIMTFIALKCALIPMYGWLPKAHGTPGAPSSVSAILSGLHIKSGVYLLVRFQEVFSVIESTELFLAIGLITALGGVLLSVAQKDIKLILAYSTVAQVGLIIVGFSISYAYSYNYIGALYHILNHAVFKAALFLSVGMVAYAYKTRDINQIRGVFKTMPLLSVAMILAIMGIIGTPLFNGSISKYFLMTGIEWWLNTILIIVNLGTITIFMKFSAIFFGPKQKDATHKVDVWHYLPVLTLSGLCFVGGLLGVQAIELFFGVSVAVDMAGYIEKAIIFLGSVTAGYLLYKYVVRNSKFLEKVRGFELGFREMMGAIGVSLAVIILYAGFWS